MRKLAFLLLLLLLLQGCAPAAPAETPQPAVDVTPEAASMPLPTPAPTLAPTPEPTPEPTPLPTPTPVPLPLYKVRVSELNVRSEPSTASDDTVIGMLYYEDTVGFLEEAGDFIRVRLADGTEAYCFADYLVPADTVLYAYVKPETAQKVDIATGALVFEDDGITPVMVKNELVDLKLYLPDAEYEQLFNTTQNVIGEPLYGRTVFLLQRDVAKKLQKAYGIFKEDGYTLKVYDAYRPLRVQRRLFEVVQNPHWIADPATTASNHNRGAAVDISLIDDATGQELTFPTPMHTFSEDSARTSTSWSEEARKNVDYMTEVMDECGFNSIKSEWWHFSCKNRSRYMTTDIDLSTVTMLPYEALPENGR